MPKIYTLVEGHGEVEAAQNLLTRMSRRAGLYTLTWAAPQRFTNLDHWDTPKRGGVRRGAELIRGVSDAAGLLILKDEDDGCPKQLAPQITARLAQLQLPFPVAYVLLRPEYEVLFLPCLHRMSEHGFPAQLQWPHGADWEHKRGVKEWLSAQLPKGIAYKPTVDQLALTRALDLDELEGADVPCYGTLWRAILYLGAHLSARASVYPAAAMSAAR